MSRLNQKGQGLVEYILIVALLGVLSIAALNQMGSTTRDGFTRATNSLDKEFKKIK